MSGAAPVLEMRGVKVARGDMIILQVPSLAVREGTVLSLIGPNGAGKSTLLLALSSIARPSAGEILFRGEKVEGGDSSLAFRRRIAMVFQEPLLFDTSVFANVAAGLAFRGLSRREIASRVEEGLTRFGISHLRDRSARTLSGGEAQRTSLARALAVRPDLLLLDEPFSALDPPTRESLMGDLERTLRETRTTAIFATHDREEALRLSDRMAVMNRGVIVQEGAPAEVMNRPADEFVASFVGMETILAGRVREGNGGSFLVQVDGQLVEAVGDALPGETVLLCVRPENVTLSVGAPSGGTSARNHFPGVITRMSTFGHYLKVQLDCGFPLTAFVTHHSAEEMILREQAAVTASFKATAIHVIRKGNQGGCN